MSDRCGFDRCTDPVGFHVFATSVGADSCAVHLADVVRVVKAEDLAEGERARERRAKFRIVRNPAAPVMVSAL